MGTSVMKYMRASGCFLFRFLERKKKSKQKGMLLSDTRS